MNKNSTSVNVKETKSPLTGKAIAIATALVMVLSFGALGAYGEGGGVENEAGTLATNDPTAVLVNVEAPEAIFTVGDQVLTGAASGFFTPIDKKLIFVVEPIEGYEIMDVAIDGVSQGDYAGAYVVEDADVRDTITVTVTCQAIGGGGSTDPVAARIPVTVAVENLEVVFDGNPHSPILEVTDETGAMLEGWYARADLPEFVNVTGEPQEVTCSAATIYDANDVDVTEQCDITFVPGSVNITPAIVKITTPSAEKVFDGAALTASDGTTLEPPILGEDEFNRFINVVASFAVTGSQTEIGESQNTYTLNWEGVDQNNYTVVEELGTLKVLVNEAPITITAESKTQVYTGQPIEATQADIAVPDGFTVEAVVSGSQTNAGTSESVVESYTIFDADGNDVTDTFADVLVQNGKLTVTPATLAVNTPAAHKQYDGQPLTATAENWITGFVNGETATATITGTQTEVGVSDNTYSIEWNGTASQDNYTIIENLGKLEVLRIDPGETPYSEGNNTPDDNGGAAAGGAGTPAAGGTTGGAAGGATGGTAGTPTGGTTAGAAADGVTPIAGTPGVNYLSESTPAAGAEGAAAAGEATSPVDAVAEGMQNAARGVIGEDPIPLTAPSVTELSEDGTPLGAFDAPMNNWVRWYVVVGIIATALYGAGVLMRRRNFTRGLENQENELLGVAPEAAEVATPAAEVVQS